MLAWLMRIALMWPLFGAGLFEGFVEGFVDGFVLGSAVGFVVALALGFVDGFVLGSAVGFVVEQPLVRAAARGLASAEAWIATGSAQVSARTTPAQAARVRRGLDGRRSTGD